jgi:hypothetical protein
MLSLMIRQGQGFFQMAVKGARSAAGPCQRRQPSSSNWLRGPRGKARPPAKGSEVRHLIHIGYAKAGTHFVQRWFASHPQIRLIRDRTLAAADKAKAAGAADDPSCRWTAISSEEYASPPDVFGAGLPDAQADICAALAAGLPDAHILLLTRGFRSVLVSGYSQYVRGGGDKDFYVFREVDPAELAHAAHAWDYNYLVDIYRRAFGDRVIALPYELLRDNPAAFVSQLEARLDVGACEVALDRINPALKPHELRWYPRMTRALRRLPGSAATRERLVRWHARRLSSKPWRLAALGLQFVMPAKPVAEALIADEHVEYFRGRADVFRGDPAYTAYHADYLIS